MRSLVLRIALVVVLMFGAAGQAAAATPKCATHNEWHRVIRLMLPATVAGIIDNNGRFVDTPNPNTFARRYNLCWTKRHGKVWFDQRSRLSFRKAII